MPLRMLDYLARIIRRNEVILSRAIASIRRVGEVGQ